MPAARRRLGSFLLASLLAACAARPPAADRAETQVQAQQRRAHAARPAYNLAGYPPAVRDGYIDGCESAKRTPYAHKDAARFRDDPRYATGWRDGFAICGGR